MVSWETCAYADGFPIPDLVTVSADSPNRALELAIATWLDVTFPALRGLCDPHFESADRQIALTSLTGGEFLSWKVFYRRPEFFRPRRGGVARAFRGQPRFLSGFGRRHRLSGRQASAFHQDFFALRRGRIDGWLRD